MHYWKKEKNLKEAGLIQEIEEIESNLGNNSIDYTELDGKKQELENIRKEKIKVEFLTCVLCDCTNSVEIWPLFQSTCAASTATITQIRTTCPATFGGYDSVENIVPMQFRGGKSSFIDLGVSTTSAAVHEDFGISVFVKLYSLNGTILHYEAQSIVALSLEGTKDIQLSVQDGFLTLTRTFATISDTQVITEDSVTLTTNIWYLIAFIYDVSMGKAEFFIDGQGFGKKGLQVKDKYYLGPGVLRLGSSFDVSAPKLNGLLNCVQFHANNDDDFYKSTCLTRCGDIPNYSLWFPKRNYGMFVNVGDNFEPTISSVTNGVGTYDSWTNCSLACLRNYDNCISFTTEILTDGDLLCTMYDQIQSSGLQMALGKSYYRLLDN